MTEQVVDPHVREQLLAAADRLFYTRGVQNVGMDAVRSEAGISLKRMYQVFPSKDALLAEVLRRRRAQWDDGMAAAATGAVTSRERLLRVFDFLDAWFREEDFRGCTFVNSFAELGAVSPEVAQLAREHKVAFQRYVADLVAELGGTSDLAAQIALLAEGAQTTAAITGSPVSARHARAAAETLLDASTAGADGNT
jgi:AcrR family transcriptional regulator